MIDQYVKKKIRCQDRCIMLLRFPDKLIMRTNTIILGSYSWI